VKKVRQGQKFSFCEGAWQRSSDLRTFTYLRC